MGPKNHVLDGSPYPHGKGQFWWIEAIVGLRLLNFEICIIMYQFNGAVFIQDFLQENVLLPKAKLQLTTTNDKHSYLAYNW